MTPNWVPWAVGAAFFAGVFLTMVLWGLCGAAKRGDARRGDETEERYGFDQFEHNPEDVLTLESFERMVQEVEDKQAAGKGW